MTSLPSNRSSGSEEPARDDPAGSTTEVAPPAAPLSDRGGATPPDDDAHPADPSRTRSGRFRKDFVHNETGRRGKRASKGEADLAALLRAIAQEPIDGVHPITGRPMTVVEGLVRSLLQTSFKQPRIGLAVLEIMVRSGALPLSAPEQAGSADGDAATITGFLERAHRQDRARAATAGDEVGEVDVERGR